MLFILFIDRDKKIIIGQLAPCYDIEVSVLTYRWQYQTHTFETQSGTYAIDTGFKMGFKL